MDDSVVVRKLVGDALGADPACEVVGTAANGKIALARIVQVNPDVVTLDVEMPEMDGLATLAEIRRLYPRLAVIMLSAHTERAASATLRALALGASDYVTKPSGMTLTAAIQQLREQLLTKVKVLGGARGGGPPTGSPTRAIGATRFGARASAPGLVEVVAIGCSTGGPNALTSVLESFPSRLGVPMFIVQHMPPVFTRLFADRLRSITKLNVREAAGGELVEKGDVWVAPGDHHMIIKRDGLVRRIALLKTPPENSCRPAVDILFRSVVECYGGRTLAIVLTGMGQDGLRGCQEVREAGGQIVVQDEATSVVWGMPGFVANAGLADAIVPIGGIALEVTRRIGGGPGTSATPFSARTAS